MKAPGGNIIIYPNSITNPSKSRHFYTNPMQIENICPMGPTSSFPGTVLGRHMLLELIMWIGFPVAFQLRSEKALESKRDELNKIASRVQGER